MTEAAGPAEERNERQRRYRATIPFLQGGFRPFFLGAAAWAIAVLILWVGAFQSGESPVPHLDALSWHRHEMLFGFVGAAIAGFILTAVPNWTGRLPIAGRPLAFLASIWLAARLLPVLGLGWAGLWIALDTGFYLLLAVLIFREIRLAGNRNLPAAMLIFLFGIADAADLFAVRGWGGDPQLGIRMGIALVVMLLGLIGGRIVPSFTRNWLMKNGAREGLPVQPNRFDLIVLAATAVALVSYVAIPTSRWAGWGLLGASLFQIIRWIRWRGFATWRSPIVVVLHVAYLWVPVGIALLGWSLLGGTVPQSAAIHALTAGAMSTMILAVMTRASLGHTGRELRADTPTVAIYIAITVAALLRVGASLGLGDYMAWMHFSAGFWVAAFGLFILAYGPKLIGPQVT